MRWVAAVCLLAACGPRQGAEGLPADSANPATVVTDTLRPVRPGAPVAGAVAPVPVPAEDSLAGVVERVGNEPLSVLVLRVPGGTFAALEGVPALAAAEGLEVMVAGRSTARREPVAGPGEVSVFVVDWFEVRAAGGVPAHDGRVEAAGGWALRTRDGRRLPTPHLPVALRELVGARVFLVGPLDLPPAAYGILAMPD